MVMGKERIIMIKMKGFNLKQLVMIMVEYKENELEHKEFKFCAQCINSLYHQVKLIYKIFYIKIYKTG